jgi:hypothetical protein
MVITFLLLPKNQAEPVKHLGQFWISTYPLSGSVFGQRQQAHGHSQFDEDIKNQMFRSGDDDRYESPETLANRTPG